MDAYKSLEDARGKSASNKGKKPNAIEQHKQQEKDRQALIKHQQADLKARKHGEEEDRKKAIKTERVFEEKTSRRARGDARDEAKKAEKGDHEVCEHGIIKCRICNPPTDKANHRGQAAPRRGGDESD